MSQEAREALVAQLAFSDDTQKSDLLNPDLTSTYLIAMLADLVKNAGPILILAVRTDHPSEDGWWAHSGGFAVDLYPKDWEGQEEQACTRVMKALAENPYCYAVGLGGVTQQWESYVTWPGDPFVVFPDNTADHIHAGCRNSVDGPGERTTP